MTPDPFLSALDARTEAIAGACTQCGKCFEACPMTAPAGIAGSEPAAVLAGVVDILRTGAGPEVSARWAKTCTFSGFCIDACDYGVNPRFMLSLARLAMHRRSDGVAARRAGVAKFKEMSRGVRVLSRLQLPPDLLRRVSRAPAAGEGPPDLVFYTGCNILKTPHIALLCFDVLDALGVRYAVSGGPADCCGTYQMKAGDAANAGRQAFATMRRFAETGAGEVLSWCPTCQLVIGETMSPLYGDVNGPTPFGVTMMGVYLADRLDELRPLFVHPVEKRVALHEHPGSRGVSEAVTRILKAIPGLEFVDLDQPRVGYMCNGLNTLPDFKRAVHEDQLRAAEAAGVTTLAGVYHACHRDLCSHERDWPFEVVNFMEIIGEAMGIRHEDAFKRLKMLQDVDAVIAECLPLIERHGLDLEEVRAVVVEDMLGEQTLPLRSS